MERLRFNIERIVIIDHDNHNLWIEDVSDEALEKYRGEEEKYIKDNYQLGEHWSWDWITLSMYIPENCDDPIEINFKDLID